MFLTRTALPRRTILRGLGASLALPFLDAMVPAGTLLAQTPARPTPRIGFVYMPNGVARNFTGINYWTPAGEGTAFELSPILAPLAPFRDRTVVVSGLAQHQADAFDDGAKFDIPFELLRIESPSAENKGHGDQAPPPVKGKANVNVVRADPVGRYAVRIGFDDGHDTGLYSWDYLYDLGDIELKMSGCMNACGHHHVGHIGILGVDKNGEEWYQITLGGSASGLDAALGQVIGPSVRHAEVSEIIERILNVYVAERENGERFIDTFRRIGIAPFKSRVYAPANQAA